MIRHSYNETYRPEHKIGNINKELPARRRRTYLGAEVHQDEERQLDLFPELLAQEVQDE